MDAGRTDDNRHRQATILSAAQNVLAHACRWDADQASDALLDAALHHHLSTLQLARGLIELVSDLHEPSTLHGPAAAAFKQWGPKLLRSHQLLGGTVEIASLDPPSQNPQRIARPNQ
jgi:hypothetical protein